MISPEIPYEEYFVKKEENIEYLDDLKDELELDSQQIIFEKETAKCGEVMVGYEGEFTFICILCMQEFTELSSFGRHIKDCHLGQNNLCMDSQEAVSNNDPLKEQGSKTFKVDIEPQSPILKTERSSPSHLLKKLDIEISGILSSSENEEATNVATSEEDSKSIPLIVFSNHRKRRSDTGEFFCAFCGRSYLNKISYSAHMKQKHDVDTREDIIVQTPHQMVCKYCDKKFNEVAQFKTHVRTHTGRKRFVCPYCPKVFASRHNRQSHINVHTGERPYKCSHCPKGFSDATNLTMHERAHLKITKYSCDYCDKRFVQSQEKKVHERTHTGEKPFQCEECGRRFISQVKLTDHTKRHKNIKNYICKVCSKAFYSSSLLKDHSIMHTNERPHHCNVCGQSFPRRKSLRAHQQLHSDEKKYVCDTCGKAFAQCAGLYSHRKSHGEKL